MVDRILRKLEALSTWSGFGATARGGASAPAFMVSLSLHAVLLVGLAFAGHHVNEAVQREFSSRVGGLDGALSVDSTLQDLDQNDATPVMEAGGSFAPTLATTVTSVPSASGRPTVSAADVEAGAPVEFAKLDVQRVTQMVVPTASMLGRTVSIEGNGAEHVQGVEGAVDRIAVEIVRRLEQGRTLVVWAFDASLSLEAERQRLVKHIETVYSHIDQLDESRLSTGGGLLTMVVSFGQDRKAETPKPTADLSAVREAINGIKADESGVETTFTTVGDIVGRWGLYKNEAGEAYHPMIIVVTDEVGDDEPKLEEAIALARKRKVPVYVLGSQAVFGRVEGFMDFYDPRTKYMHRNQPVRQGPESAMLEQIHLPFWYDGPQYDLLEAGFGPYALSRLSSATGGIYFVTRFSGRRMGFDPSRMKEYKPDWESRDRYEAGVVGSPLRKAVVNAAMLTNEQKIPNAPTLQFPSLEAPQFKEVLQTNQALAAQIAQTVEEALGPITAAARYRDREVSRRWQAHYDLIRGRLLAMKVRAYEYNSAGARLVKDPPKFQNSRSNAWRLVPDKAILYSEKAAAAGREAEELLRKVVEEHPDTPWALLAGRELKDPLGFKWVETYVPPPPRRDDAAAAQKKNRNSPAAKPPAPPKL
ncbi:MAG: VWA domain-containing protein [Paludisphaera borealis]|uniref:vWA domain-containing protein n=1 Tax=Paludisphaera borealis TaxID=1387353 RepID=UPI00284B8E2E|nr:vWA domain-containing protein [Paludisphaera borealis]MDR3619290.1 VWA domain-containing protein [Paludisphaera borealis]